jgi:hypothetical protein
VKVEDTKGYKGKVTVAVMHALLGAEVVIDGLFFPLEMG